MKLTFLSVGKNRSEFFSPAIAEYAQRLSHMAHVQFMELRESRAPDVQAKEEEGATLISKVPPRDELVAVDRQGQALSSKDFALWLGRQRDAARNVTFAIGGDGGLAERVLTKSKLVLSLSQMTFPHRLARLILVEQVYRAFTILRGIPYHK